jgi:phosphotransferase system  glucose/maltose/N-acetylglucosamine-specific IIC component
MLPVCPFCVTNPIAWVFLLILGILFVILWVLAGLGVGWAKRFLEKVKHRIKKIIEGFRK